MSNVIEHREKRQDENFNLALNEIRENYKKENYKFNHINIKALERELLITKCNSLYELLGEENEPKFNIMIRMIANHIQKMASRQGSKDEGQQLKKIDTLKEYGINIFKDGKNIPLKTGGFFKLGNNLSDKLKSIDFIIKHKNDVIGYITAKITRGTGGHQDNVVKELGQFCEWSQLQLKNDKKKIYVVLYDNQNTSTSTYNDLKEKHKNDNIIFTNTEKCAENILNWFNDVYKK